MGDTSCRGMWPRLPKPWLPATPADVLALSHFSRGALWPAQLPREERVWLPLPQLSGDERVQGLAAASPVWDPAVVWWGHGDSLLATGPRMGWAPSFQAAALSYLDAALSALVSVLSAKRGNFPKRG